MDTWALYSEANVQATDKGRLCGLLAGVKETIRSILIITS